MKTRPDTKNKIESLKKELSEALTIQKISDTELMVRSSCLFSYLHVVSLQGHLLMTGDYDPIVFRVCGDSLKEKLEALAYWASSDKPENGYKMMTRGMGSWLDHSEETFDPELAVSEIIETLKDWAEDDGDETSYAAAIEELEMEESCSVEKICQILSDNNVETCDLSHGLGRVIHPGWARSVVIAAIIIKKWDEQT